MKNYYLWIICCAFLTIAHAGLVNGDFEKYDANGKLVGWYLPQKFTADRHAGSNGSGGIVYENDDDNYQQYAQQKVDVEVGATYEFSAWVKAENVTGRGPCFLCIEFYDKDGKYISESRSNDIRKSTNGEWVKLSGLTKPVPAGTAKGMFDFCIDSRLHGKFSFDKAYFEKYVREPVAAVYTNAYRNEIFDGMIEFSAQLTPEAFKVPAAEVNAVFTIKASDGTQFSIDGYMPKSVCALSRPQSVDGFKFGRNEVTCTIKAGDKVIGEAKTHFTRLEKKAKKTVEFDMYGRTLLNGKLFFPYGMYTGRTFFKDENFKRYCEAPFNTFMQYGHATKEELDKCAKVGIMDIYDIAAWYTTPDKGMGTVSRMVRDFKNHPALLGWYMFDEVPTSQIPLLKERYEYMCKNDPNHPVWGVEDIPVELRHYIGALDVMGSDPYPVSRKPVSTATESIREENRQLMGARPIWQVVQYFGWNWHDARQSEQRRPTEAEVRNMTWQAIAGGARGIIYYAYGYLCDKEEICGEKTADLWEEMKRVAAEVKSHERVLLFADTQPIPDNQLPKGVTGRIFRENGETWRLIVNTTTEAVPSLNLPALGVTMEKQK